MKEKEYITDASKKMSKPQLIELIECLSHMAYKIDGIRFTIFDNEKEDSKILFRSKDCEEENSCINLYL